MYFTAHEKYHFTRAVNWKRRKTEILVVFWLLYHPLHIVAMQIYFDRIHLKFEM